MPKPATGAEAGLSGDDQVRITLETIAAKGGLAHSRDFYEAIESILNQRGFML